MHVAVDRDFNSRGSILNDGNLCKSQSALWPRGRIMQLMLEPPPGSKVTRFIGAGVSLRWLAMTRASSSLLVKLFKG